MLELIFLILFGGIFFKALGLAFRAAWGATKIVASLLFVAAIPLLVVCLIFASGVALLVPLALVALAFGLLKRIV